MFYFKNFKSIVYFILVWFYWIVFYEFYYICYKNNVVSLIIICNLVGIIK